MKRRLIVIGIGLVIVGVLGHRFLVERGLLGDRVEAVGELTITYNNLPLGDPVFNVSGFMPGDCVVREIDVANGASTKARVAVRSDEVVDEEGLSGQMSMVISEGAADVYGGGSETGEKTVSDYFAESGEENGVLLSTVEAGDEIVYRFEVCMKPETGNEYQGAQVMFDLIFGELPVVIELPAECKALEGIVTEVIYGTEGDDVIKGSSASELIYAVGGNNKIDGGGGHDCIIGGPGDDLIDGGSGNDIIVAGGGNNNIRGGSGDDIIYGGPGNDVIDGGTGNDIIYAGGGNNIIDGGRDDDIIYGGAGFDILRGGSGNDIIYGGEGDSEIYGGSGDDYLDGEGGINHIDGGSGIDTCLNAQTKVKCELP